MALTIVATHLGHIDDVSVRARQTIEACEVLILEEFREGSSLVKSLGIERKEMHQLNEHSKPEDIEFLLELCKSKNVCLISDCGTPNFCDPGSLLVKACRGAKVPVKALPGPSSLMHLISLSSERLDEFLFRGFLPANTELRVKALQELKAQKMPVVLMDTPYRFRKLMQELAQALPKRRALLGINLSMDTEIVLEGTFEKLAKEPLPEKAEFVLLLYKI